MAIMTAPLARPRGSAPPGAGRRRALPARGTETCPSGSSRPARGSRSSTSWITPATVTLLLAGAGTWKCRTKRRRLVMPVTCHTPGPTWRIGIRFNSRSLRLDVGAEDRVQDVVQGQHADRLAELVDHGGHLPLALLHASAGPGPPWYTREHKTTGSASDSKCSSGMKRKARQADRIRPLRRCRARSPAGSRSRAIVRRGPPSATGGWKTWNRLRGRINSSTRIAESETSSPAPSAPAPPGPRRTSRGRPPAPGRPPARYGSGLKVGQINRWESKLTMRKTGSRGPRGGPTAARGMPTSEATARGLSTARLLGNISPNTISTSSDAAANRPACGGRSLAFDGQPGDRDDGEVGQVGQQVPEEHGGEQPVGVAQQSGGDPLGAVARGQPAAVMPGEVEQGRLAGGEERRGEGQQTHGDQPKHYCSQIVVRPVATSNSLTAGTNIAMVVKP